MTKARDTLLAQLLPAIGRPCSTVQVVEASPKLDIPRWCSEDTILEGPLLTPMFMEQAFVTRSFAVVTMFKQEQGAIVAWFETFREL